MRSDYIKPSPLLFSEPERGQTQVRPSEETIKFFGPIGIPTDSLWSMKEKNGKYTA